MTAQPVRLLVEDGIRRSNDGGGDCLEDDSLRYLNEEIVRRLGGSWHDPPLLAAGWERRRDLGDLLERARRVIGGDYSGGWRCQADPLACITLPLWQAALPQAQMHTVICLRNPLDVASCLRRRHGLRRDVAFQLWWRYTSDVLRHTDGTPRAFVFYEDCLQDLRGVLAHLAAVLGLGDAVDAPIVSMAEASVRGPASGRCSRLADVLDDPDVPFGARMLYQGLVGLRATALLGAAREEIEEALTSLCDAIQGEAEGVLRLQGELQAQQVLAAERQALLVATEARLEAVLAAMEAERGRWLAELEDLRGRWQSLKASTGYRLWEALHSFVDGLLPPGSWRRRCSAALLRRLVHCHKTAGWGRQPVLPREAPAAPMEHEKGTGGR